MIRLVSAAAALLCLASGAGAQPKAGKPLPAGAILRLDHEESPKEGSVCSAVYSPDGKLVATAAEARVNSEGRVTLWDAETGRQLWRAKTDHHTLPCAIAFAADGKTLAGCGNFGFLKRWDAADGNATSIETPRTDWWDVAFSPDGRHLATGGCYGELTVWDAKSGKPLRSLDGNHNMGRQISRVLFAPDGETLLSTHTHGTVFWDHAAGTLLRDFRIDGTGLMNPAFSPDGKYLAARTDALALRILDWQTGKHVRTIAGVNAPEGQVGVWCCAFSPDGHTIAVAQWNVHTVLLYEAETGRQRARFAGHTDRVCTLAFAPHGRSLASASLDHSAIVWDVTGRWDGKWLSPKLADAELDRLWSDLGGDNAETAYQAVWALALSPEQSVPFLAGKFFPKELAGLIVELEDDLPGFRLKAFEGLKEYGPLAASALRRAKPRLPQAKDAIQRLLDPKLARQLSPSRRLQMTRAMEALELAACPLARRLLHDLAAEDWVADEARAALKRLSSRADGTSR